jgi:hypothetical protein
MTDELLSYDGLDNEYAHKVINHAESYVDGNVHTNRMENFWSLLKRSIKGTYVSVEPFHLFRYLDEQSFRYNERELTDSERFQKVLGSVAGKRLTWMSPDPKPKEKAEEESQQGIKKTREYRNFRKLLKQVIKAPPMKRAARE